jgi:hypothetical protein
VKKASDESDAIFIGRLLRRIAMSRRNDLMGFVSNPAAAFCIILFY